MKKITITILFFLFSFQIFSQIKNDNILQKTYQLLEKGSYNELIEYSKKVLDNDIDFFYLRLRLGIAYFKLNNYKLAVYHLEKSLEFNSDDEVALEYLYYAYLYSGMRDEANKLSKEKGDFIKSNNNSNEKIIQNLYFETGFSLSNNYSKNANFKFDGGKGIYGESNLNDNTLYSHLGAKLSISPNINLYNGFNFINVKNYSIYYIKNNLKSFEYNLKQWDYYLNTKFILKNNLSFTPSIHLINVSTKNYYTTINSNQDILINNNDKKFLDYVLSSNIAYNYKKFLFVINGSYSKLNENNQFQLGGDVMFFIFGNLDLYTQTSFIYLHSNDSAIYLQKHNSLIFNQMIGGKINNKLWAEVGLAVGNMKNYNESNGFVVYNIPDVIKLKTFLNFIYTYSSKIELSLRYQFLNRKDTYAFNEDIETIKNGIINYQNQTIIGGIKWNF